MTRSLFLVPLLFAVAVPALAADPAPAAPQPNELHVPHGSVLVKYPDGSVEVIPPEIAAQQAEAQRLESEAKAQKLKAQAEAIDDPSTNTLLLGRPAVTTPTNPEELSVCGFGMDQEAFSGRQQRKLAPLVPECLEAQAKLVDAVNRGKNAGKAIDQKVAFHADGDSTAVMDGPAITDALSDNDNGGVNGVGGVGGVGYGIPFGGPNSIFTGVQTNALGWQAVAAGHLGISNRTDNTDNNDDSDTKTKVVVKEVEVVRAPTTEEIEAAVEARLKAEGH